MHGDQVKVGRRGGVAIHGERQHIDVHPRDRCMGVATVFKVARRCCALRWLPISLALSYLAPR